MRRSALGPGLTLALLALWVLLWGHLSVANLLSGLAVVGLVGLVLPPERPRPEQRRWPVVRPVWALRFVGRVLVDLVRANHVVGREVLRRHPTVATGVVAVPLPACSDGVVTLLVDVVSLAPGTLPLEVTTAPRVLYVHVLHLRDADVVRRDLEGLAGLAVRAFGSPDHVAALDASAGPSAAGVPGTSDGWPDGEHRP